MLAEWAVAGDLVLARARVGMQLLHLHAALGRALGVVASRRVLEQPHRPENHRFALLALVRVLGSARELVVRPRRRLHHYCGFNKGP